MLHRPTKQMMMHTIVHAIGQLSKPKLISSCFNSPQTSFSFPQTKHFLMGLTHPRNNNEKTKRQQKKVEPHTCFYVVINVCATYRIARNGRGAPNAADPVVLLLHVITSHNMRAHTLTLTASHETYVNVHRIVHQHQGILLL